MSILVYASVGRMRAASDVSSGLRVSEAVGREVLGGFLVVEGHLADHLAARGPLDPLVYGVLRDEAAVTKFEAAAPVAHADEQDGTCP